MQHPLQITFHGMEHSDAIERRVRDKAAELERFDDHMTSCHVTVEAPHKHHHKGNLYTVRVDLHLPGEEIVAGRERRHDHSHEDVYVAIRDSFDAVVRRLEDYVRRRGNKVKRHDVPAQGSVNKLFSDEGYGFVRMSDGTDVYFHENSVTGAVFSGLAIGDEVRVVVAEGEGEKGPQASTVELIGKHHVSARPSS